MSRKPTPPEQTFAEVYYYLKQMHSKSPVVIVMKDGEELKGWIEWYDRDVIKLNRHEGPNLMLFKDGIKYIYKDEEHSGAEEREETTEE
ncbi:MAG TPA: RNA chaperone Hfq [Thermoanaerobaculia bacterium]|nr:RNA chaperone Hfq [Thermoanaerobaculia bacterium]HUM30173.1 RNA chaperone Hfq [Thermoanaerobaculia bacterium]HXK68378.1 RNA chaperone Hfq [Thermoanaerobaculia bacterium]